MPDGRVQKVAADALAPGHVTAGVLREEAILVGDLWSGRALTEPGIASDWHHHGEHDTIAYVVRGALRVETATDVVEGGPATSCTCRRTPCTGRATQARRHPRSW